MSESRIYNNQARNVPFQGNRPSNTTYQMSSKNRQNSNQNRYHQNNVLPGQVASSANQQQTTQQALSANQQPNQAQQPPNYNGNNNNNNHNGYFSKGRKNSRGGGIGNRNNQRQFRPDTRANQPQAQYQTPIVNQIVSPSLVSVSGNGAPPNGVVATPITPQLAAAGRYPDQPAYMPIDGMAPMGYFPIQPMPIGAYTQCEIPNCVECLASSYSGMGYNMPQFFMPTFQYLPAAMAPYGHAPISGYLMDTSLSPSTTPSSSDSNSSGSVGELPMPQHCKYLPGTSPPVQVPQQDGQQRELLTISSGFHQALPVPIALPTTQQNDINNGYQPTLVAQIAQPNDNTDRLIGNQYGTRVTNPLAAQQMAVNEHQMSLNSAFWPPMAFNYQRVMGFGSEQQQPQTDNQTSNSVADNNATTLNQQSMLINTSNQGLPSLTSSHETYQNMLDKI